MAKHIHIYFSPRKAVRDQAPGSVPPSNINALVEALHEAIAARQGTTNDAGWDESKVKRDEGGRFSAQQHEAAAAEHKAAAEKHDAAYKATNDPQHALARNAHQEAGVQHAIAAKHVLAQTGWSSHNAQQAHNATALAKQMSAKTVGPASIDQLKAIASNPQASLEERAQAVAQLSKMEKMANEVAASPFAAATPSPGGQPMATPSPSAGAGAPQQPAVQAPAGGAAPQPQPQGGKPTSATAKGAKAATHELLSSGHPFSVDELMKATGCNNKATLMTALSDLKSPKYAGKLGHLAIEKNPDGTFQVKKNGQPLPAQGEAPKRKMDFNQQGEQNLAPSIAGKKDEGSGARTPNTPHYGGSTTGEKQPKPGPAGGSALPMRTTPKGGDVNPAQNIQARIDAKKPTLEQLIKKNQSLGLSPDNAKRMALKALKWQAAAAKRGGAQGLLGNKSHELVQGMVSAYAQSPAGAPQKPTIESLQKQIQEASNKIPGNTAAAAAQRMKIIGPLNKQIAALKAQDPSTLEGHLAQSKVGADGTVTHNGSPIGKIEKKTVLGFKQVNGAPQMANKQVYKATHASGADLGSADTLKDAHAKLMQHHMQQSKTEKPIAHASATGQSFLPKVKMAAPGGIKGPSSTLPPPPSLPNHAPSTSAMADLTVAAAKGDLDSVARMKTSHLLPAVAQYQRQLVDHLEAKKPSAGASTPKMNVDPISHKTSMPGVSTHQGAIVSGAPAPSPALVQALHTAAKAWPGAAISPDKVEAAAKYMHGKSGVDILKMAEATGLSHGAAKHLNEARKAHYAANSGGGGGGGVHQAIKENYFKQKHIGLVKK